MLIDDVENLETIGSGQIKSIEFPNIILQTEANQLVKIKTTKQQQADVIFWEAIMNIKEAEIWLPFQKEVNYLLDFDWLVDPQYT
ncbi:hypothetical protein [Carnobacterium mobile]|uniref:hypothetical protein n=1 Tax=Carnobacterium mobile TaxID=2750 RepID=UPI0005524495|nr:hypothetical protein [Carnobacterium mobile]